MINTFYSKHLEKLTVTFPLLDSIPLIARLIVKQKRKHGRKRPTKSAKQAKKVEIFWLHEIYFTFVYVAFIREIEVP